MGWGWGWGEDVTAHKAQSQTGGSQRQSQPFYGQGSGDCLHSTGRKNSNCHGEMQRLVVLTLEGPAGGVRTKHRIPATP